MGRTKRAVRSGLEGLLAGLALAAGGCAPGAVVPLPERHPSVRPAALVVNVDRGVCVMYCGGSAPGRSQKALVIVDGVRVPFEHVRSIEPTSIVSIEIVQASEAVERYGPGAAHGAVILRTRRAVPPPGP